MNFVGKVFVVLITVMSVVFMSFALMVYAAHRNWKTAIESTDAGQLGWRAQLKTEKEKNEALVKEREDLKTAVAAERQAQRQALAKVESERDEMTKKRDALQSDRDALNLKDQESVAALATAQTQLAKLTKEVEGLRGEIRQTQEERDKQFKQVVTVNDQIHQVSLELRVVKEREQQVAAQFAKLKATAERLGWSGIDVVSDLHGKILAVNAEDLVEVSIGKNDGLKVGNTLEVFRGSKYLGRVEVVKMTDNRAVAKILRDFKQGPMQKGDDVASRLKLG